MLKPSTVSFCHCPLPFPNLPGLETQHTKDSLIAIGQRLSALTQRIEHLSKARQGKGNVTDAELLDLYVELSTITVLLNGPSSEW